MANMTGTKSLMFCRIGKLLCLLFLVSLVRCDSGLDEPAERTKPPKPSVRLSPMEKVKKATVFVEVWYRPIEYPDPRPASLIKFSGSGFVVRPDGLIVTNAHVVASVVQLDKTSGEMATQTTAAQNRVVYVLHRVTVRFNSGTRDKRVVSAQVLCTRHLTEADGAPIVDGSSTDLALLRVRVPEPLTALSIATPSEIKKLKETTPVISAGFPQGESRNQGFGEAVGLAGNPDGPSISLRRGTITAFMRAFGSQLRGIEHDCNTTPGSSGGPLVDVQGRVLGVHFLGYAKARSGYAIPATQIHLHFGRTLNWARRAGETHRAPRTLRLRKGETLADTFKRTVPGDTIQLDAGDHQVAGPGRRALVARGVRIVGAGTDRTTLRGWLYIRDASAPCEISDLTMDSGEALSERATLEIHGYDVRETFIHDVRVLQARVDTDKVDSVLPGLWIGGGAENRPDLVNCEVVLENGDQGVVIAGKAQPRFERLSLQDATKGSRRQREFVKVCNNSDPSFIGCRMPPLGGASDYRPAVRIAGGGAAFVGCLFAFREEADVPGAAVDIVDGMGFFSACHFSLTSATPHFGSHVAIRVVRPGILEVNGCRFVARYQRPIMPLGRPLTQHQHFDFRSFADYPVIAILGEGLRDNRGPFLLPRRNHFLNCCFGVGSSGRNTSPVSLIGWVFRVDRRQLYGNNGNKFEERSW